MGKECEEDEKSSSRMKLSIGHKYMNNTGNKKIDTNSLAHLFGEKSSDRIKKNNVVVSKKSHIKDLNHNKEGTDSKNKYKTDNSMTNYITRNESNIKNNSRIQVSQHESSSLQLRKLFCKLEEGLLTENPWYLAGEITSDKRPINSAMEIEMDFKRTANHLFKASKETHVALEDIIRKRILDGRFDDTPVESHTKHNINSKDLSEMKSKKKNM